MTINPLEANELTLPLPESPKKFDDSNFHSSTFDTSGVSSVNNNRIQNSRRKSNSFSYGHRSIANTTIIVDDDGNEVIQGHNGGKDKERMLSVDSCAEDDDFRRCIKV